MYSEINKKLEAIRAVLDEKKSGVRSMSTAELKKHVQSNAGKHPVGSAKEKAVNAAQNELIRRGKAESSSLDELGIRHYAKKAATAVRRFMRPKSDAPRIGRSALKRRQQGA